MLNIASSHFSIKLEHTPDGARLVQQILHPVLHTSSLPGTYEFLAKNVATIFQNQCFNEQQLTFAEEVKATEIGHLFEHLILEFLKIEAEKESDQVVFRGETSWDFRNKGYGKFMIDIALTPADWKFLDIAIENAVRVLDELYGSHSIRRKAGFFNPTLANA